MSTRSLETEQKEAAARDKFDGWVGEIAFAIPLMILSGIVWFAAMFGMHFIQWGSLFTQG